MVLYEVVLKVTHDCPFCNVSKKFPALKMFVWCNREYEAIEIATENPTEYSAARHELAKIGRIVDESFDGTKVHMILKECTCKLENSVGKNIDAFNLLHISPAVYGAGWEYYRIVAFQHTDLKRFLQRLEDGGFVFEILRKTPFDGFLASSLTLTSDALFSDLTEKQVDALMTAYRYGYYRIPRRANIGMIASRKQQARTTFQEHLKRAENKLVASLIPYLQLFRQAPEAKRKSLKIVAT